MTAKTALKVLYISDSLGTPIHPRGIFNYSVSFIEMLKGLGAEVTLAVERAPGYGAGARLSKQFKQYGAAAINGVQLGEIYRYFATSHFTFNWRYRTWWFRFLAERLPPVARALQRLEELITRHHQTLVVNDLQFIDFVPEKAAHLKQLDSFAVLDRFYSSQASRAANGMDPIEIDARTFDIAVVDTPTYVRISGIDPSRIITIVHDLIPLRDPSMDAQWRRLFIKKIEATLALNGHMIFVSEHTRALFKEQFPKFRMKSDTVIYPPIRQDLMAAGGRSPGRGADLVLHYVAMSYEQHLLDIAERSGTKNIIAEVKAAVDSLTPRFMRRPPSASETPRRRPQPMSPAAQQDVAQKVGWDNALPYFATPISDEPRKNIALLVAAFAQLRGEANIVVMGEVVTERYGGGVVAHPNICFTGYIGETDKTEIIGGSAGLIFPSLSEGFGIPIVEGAVLGAPVLCSDISVFQEVAGDLAFYFNPNDAGSLVAAVRSALADFRGSQKRAAGLRASVIGRFSQETMAKKVAGMLETAVPTKQSATPIASTQTQSPS